MSNLDPAWRKILAGNFPGVEHAAARRLVAAGNHQFRGAANVAPTNEQIEIAIAAHCWITIGRTRERGPSRQVRRSRKANWSKMRNSSASCAGDEVLSALTIEKRLPCFPRTESPSILPRRAARRPKTPCSAASSRTGPFAARASAESFRASGCARRIRAGPATRPESSLIRMGKDFSVTIRRSVRERAAYFARARIKTILEAHSTAIAHGCARVSSPRPRRRTSIPGLISDSGGNGIMKRSAASVCSTGAFEHVNNDAALDLVHD